MTTAPHSDVATKRERLSGDELLSFMDGTESSMSKTQQCLGAGYVTERGTPAFTDFYEAVLKARNIYYVIKDAERKVECADWYDNLTDQDQELYTAIQERYSDIDRLDANQCQEFMDELSDHGITTGDQFLDAHYYQTPSWDAEAEFSQHYAEEIACLDVCDGNSMSALLVIDWQATWDCNLRHDFFTISFDGETFFFNANF